MAKNADMPHMIKNLVFIYVMWRLFTWEPFWGVIAVVVLLAFQIGVEVGFKRAAGAPREPDRPSGTPDPTSTRRKPLFPMALKEHLDP